MPTFELPGKPVLAQSNAILVYIGRRWGMHPKDDFEAARHEMMMGHVEDLRHTIGATLRMADDDKRRAREAIAETTLPAWAAGAEKQIGDGPFFAGAKLHVVDVKLFVIDALAHRGQARPHPAGHREWLPQADADSTTRSVTMPVFAPGTRGRVDA